MPISASTAVPVVTDRGRRPGRLSRRARRLWLTAHIVSSVGWLGGAYTMLVLGAAAIRSDQAGYRTSLYRTMHLFDRAVNIPLATAMLVTGLVVALGGPWGLVRHRWVLVKLVLSLAVPLGTVLLSVPRVLALEAASTAGAAPGRAGVELIVISSIVVSMLTAITLISVFKPWGPVRRARVPGRRRP